MIIAVVNQKGGVGKTTTCVALAYNLARSGRRVLVVDMDPQANTTSTFGLSPDDAMAGSSTFAYFATRGPLEPREIASGIHLIPSHIGLAHTERSLYAEVAREQRLAQGLRPLAASYDVVLIDCPPSLGILTYNALAACDTVLAPIQVEPYAMDGISMLLDTVHDVRAFGLNDRCELGGAVLTMVDRRRNVDARIADTIRDALHEKVFRTVIPRDVRLVEMAENGALALLDGDSQGAVAYRELTKEVMTRWSL